MFIKKVIAIVILLFLSLVNRAIGKENVPDLNTLFQQAMICSDKTERVRILDQISLQLRAMSDTDRISSASQMAALYDTSDRPDKALDWALEMAAFTNDYRLWERVLGLALETRNSVVESRAREKLNARKRAPQNEIVINGIRKSDEILIDQFRDGNYRVTAFRLEPPQQDALMVVKVTTSSDEWMKFVSSGLAGGVMPMREDVRRYGLLKQDAQYTLKGYDGSQRTTPEGMSNSSREWTVRQFPKEPTSEEIREAVITDLKNMDSRPRKL